MARPFIRVGIIAAAGSLLLALAALYGGLLASGQAGPKRTDFVPSFAAAQLVSNGRGSAIYELDRLGKSEEAVVRPLRVVDGVMPYLYPPALAVALSPLAHLGYDDAFLFWLLLNVVLLLATGELLRRYLMVDRAGAAVLFTVGASFLPVLIAMAQGQVSVLLLTAAVAALVALRGGRDVLAGTLVSVLAIKPTYLLPVLVILAVRGRWRALAGAAGMLLGAAGLAAGVLGPQILLDYGRVLASASHWQTQIGGFSLRWNQSAYGVTALAGPDPAQTVAVVVLLAGLAAVLVRSARGTTAVDVPFAAAIVVGLLASPHVLIHDLSLLLLPAAVVWRQATMRVSLKGGVLGFGYLAVLVGAPLTAGAPLPAPALASLSLGVILLLIRPPLPLRADCGAQSPTRFSRLLRSVPIPIGHFYQPETNKP